MNTLLSWRHIFPILHDVFFLTSRAYIVESSAPILCVCFYRPQRSCEGYVFTGVCLSTGGVSVHGGVSAPGRAGIPACTEADPPAGETATAADGTHPTGMHSCFIC